jgi:hypothetical protein
MTTATARRHHRTAQITNWKFAARTSHVEAAVGPSISDVCALIDAAGPLTLRDLAGGLNVPLRQASQLVVSMLDSDCLKQDEWARYRLWGSCRD